MSVTTNASLARKALAWMRSENGQRELSALGARFGFCDGWEIVHAIRKTSPHILKYETICLLVEEVRIERRQEAISRRTPCHTR